MILKVEKNSNYTVIDNAIFKNKALSLKAKGLLCIMLSLPDGWHYTLAGLASLSADGLDATRNALKELETAGYYSRRQTKVDGKFSDAEYVIRECPTSEKPTLEKPLLENPISGNPTLLNTNRLNTNKSSKEKIDIYSEVQAKYNAVCIDMPQCIKMTDKRKRHIKARLAEHDMPTIVMAMRKMQDSDFLSGRSGKWQANIDWLFANDTNIVKVIEGKYDNRAGDSTHERLKKAFLEVQHE